MCYWKIATKALSKISSCCPATTGTCGAGGSNQRDLLRLPESALVAGTVAVPAFAQSPPAGNATSSPATHHTRAPMGTPSERNAALIAVRALWREMRADRLEADVLGELFAADAIEDEAERRSAKAAGMRALGTVLRYRARIECQFAAAIHDLGELQQRRLAPSQASPPKAARPDEPEPANRPVTAPPAAVPDEPEPRLNRHQRRALAAMERQAPRRAA